MELLQYLSGHWVEWLFAIISAVLGFGYRQISKRLKEERAKSESIAYGVQALLRDRIIQAYNHYYRDYGYCPIYAKDNISEMYRRYHTLGGNGTITELMEQLMELPTGPDKKGDELNERKAGKTD